MGEVHAGIEVAECRFPMAALPPLPAILADGAASGRYVFGDRIEAPLDRLAGVEVVLEVDGTLRRRGSGAEVMGDPLAPLLWLAEERRRLRRRARGGRDGQHRAPAPGMLPVRAGQRVRAVFGGSGDGGDRLRGVSTTRRRRLSRARPRR